MSNLVAYGCSCTFGLSLPDIGSLSTLGPSKYSWPQILSNKLNLTCVNKGKIGASNLEILSILLDTDFSEDDLIIVMWSFFDRDLIFTSDNHRTQLGSWINEDTMLSWSNLHTDYHLRFVSWMHIYTAWLHLTKLKKKFYFGLTSNVSDKDETFFMIRPKWAESITFIVNDFAQFTRDYDTGDDNQHPGVKSHAKLAEILFEKINNDYRI